MAADYEERPVHHMYHECPQGLYRVVSGLMLVLDSPMLGQAEQKKEHGSRAKVSSDLAIHFVARFRWSLHGAQRRARMVAD